MHTRVEPWTGADLAQVTPLLLTFNEAANIARTLSHLGWARRILIIDSGSSDETLAIAATHANVEVVERAFDTHAQQWNHGLSLVTTPWTLSLDADYTITAALKQEIALALRKAAEEQINGFRIPFRYCVFGRPLRGTVLPPRIALFRTKAATYIDDGHTQDLQLHGRCGRLLSPILHDDRKPLSRWLWAQNRYLRLEADKLLQTPPSFLSCADRLRRLHVIAPFAVFLICLIWQRGLLDGWRGWYYALQRLYAETLLSLILWEEQHKPSSPAP